MYPYLRIGPLSLSTYALMAVLGYLSAVSVATRVGRRRGLDPRTLVDLTFWLIVAGIIGARLAYTLENLPDYLNVCVGEGSLSTSACADFWKPWRGGFVFYGGFLGAALVSWFFVRRRSLPFWRTLDVLAPALAMGHAFGRVGCFLAGCCFGKVSSLPWAVRFPAASLAGGALRHPTQLYEAAGELAIALILILRHRRAPRDGTVLSSYLLLYGGLRFVVEVFRGDPTRAYLCEVRWPAMSRLLGLDETSLLFLSTAQAVSLTLVLLSFVLRWSLRRRTAGEPASAAAGVEARNTP